MIIHAGDFHVGGAQIHFAGNDLEPLIIGGLDLFEQLPFPEQDAISAGTLNFFEAEAAGRVGLGIKIKQQHPLAERRQAGGEIDGSGGFSDPAFLVGDRNDFGWHWRD